MSVQSPPPTRSAVQLTYRDRPEISETYADLLRVVVAEGLAIKMEFVVNRPDQPSTPGAVITGNTVTACRLVIPVQGALDMALKLNDLIEKLKGAGIIKPISEIPAVIN
jgi:hypothetical protein